MLTMLLFFSWLLAAVHYPAVVMGSCGDLQGDVVFLLDGSGSVTAPNFQIMLQFVQELVSDFDVSPSLVRVATITFSTTSTINFHLDTHPTAGDINSAVAGIAYPGDYTNTADALTTMQAAYGSGANGDRAGVPNVGIVITDGLSNDPAATETAATNAKAAGFVLFSIGIGTGVTELNAIASDPDSDRVFTVANFSGLASIKSTFQAKICTSANFIVVKKLVAAVVSSTLGPGPIAGIVVGAVAFLAAVSSGVVFCFKYREAWSNCPLAFLPLSLLCHAKCASRKVGPQNKDDDANAENGPDNSADQAPEAERENPDPTLSPGHSRSQVSPTDTRLPRHDNQAPDIGEEPTPLQCPEDDSTTTQIRPIDTRLPANVDTTPNVAENLGPIQPSFDTPSQIQPLDTQFTASNFQAPEVEQHSVPIQSQDVPAQIHPTDTRFPANFDRVANVLDRPTPIQFLENVPAQMLPVDSRLPPRLPPLRR